MRKRGVRSPDVWDAVALTFAEPVYDKRAEPIIRMAPLTGASAEQGWMRV